MDGFIARARRGLKGGCKAHPKAAQCVRKLPPDVMGYKDAREIPNYWAYAKHFVLQDHMNSRSNSENSCRLATGTGSYPG